MTQPQKDQEKGDDGKLGPAGYIALIVLVGFLAVAIWYAVKAWRAMADVPMSTMGWISLILGVIFTLALGGGLMGLLFYSSRKHYDR
jgi:hypothetical protein